MSTKQRLDAYLVENGLSESREKAQRLIMSGCVYINGQKGEKPSVGVSETDRVEVRGSVLPYVSRGGLKLKKALRVFPIDVRGVTAVDVGASTGGFTDCLLQNGAGHVYAVDVGYGQLDWKLRNDGRVTVMERHNARNMEPGWFEQAPGFGCMDVAFISIRLILPPLYQCLAGRADVVALIKPQFEAGRDKVGKKGVVRDPQTHREVVEGMLAFSRETGYALKGLDFSPITGPEGNIEFLLWLQKGGSDAWERERDGQLALEVVESARKFHAENK